ncbi:eCIS core domain-containing protein [Zavarzinella formosa]|uniref:eCIS core domain-containing protein n=1 Tax=Zavarzinella formosa TaxID=360055 RepID=UPI00031E1DED|nr:DUF4157 domain-containing protein [Zavarzinella formosa]
MAAKVPPQPHKANPSPSSPLRGDAVAASAPMAASNRSLAKLFRMASSQTPVRSPLPVSSPGDPEEREAVRVASAIMRMPAGTPPVIQRTCATCDDERAQRSATGDVSPAGLALVNQVLSGPGQPLSAATRSFFEPRLGADFSAVRVHTDTQAARSADAVQAKAYTVGNSIAFAEGQYAPQSESGKGLLAHELVHVVQKQGENASHEVGYSPRAISRTMIFRSENDAPHADEDECIKLATSPGATCPELIACIELLFERLESRAEDLFAHGGGDPGHKLRYQLILASLVKLIATYMAICNTSDYVWETEQVKDIKQRVEQIQQRQQTNEPESPNPTGHGIPDWVWTLLGAAAAAALIACATGFCEVGAIVAGLSATARFAIIWALRAAGVVLAA